MDQLNYHHLRYFWMVAREGSIKKAAERFHVSQPTLSEQISALEANLSVQLFQRSGRGLTLTDAGRLVLDFAEEIFELGGELQSALKSNYSKARKLQVGIVDSMPKLMSYEILRPALTLQPHVQLICREGKFSRLLEHLAAGRLDVILTDEAANTSLNIRVFNHKLGECSVSFVAIPSLAERLKPNFPHSLHRAPALLPAGNSALRHILDHWFEAQEIVPDVRAEFEDAALAKVAALDGYGYVALPSAMCEEASMRYGLKVIGEATDCRNKFYLITTQRRLVNPAVAAMTIEARKGLE